MAKPKVEFVVAEVTRGFRMNGQSVFPAKKDDKGKVTPKVVKLEKRFAMQLESASKVKILDDQKTKTNAELPKREIADDDFEALAES
jgi:hypothetical protein